MTIKREFKFDPAVMDHLIACMKMWKIHVTSDGRFYDGPDENDTEIAENHLRSMMRQELRIMFKLSELQRQRYIKTLLAMCVLKAKQKEKELLQ